MKDGRITQVGKYNDILKSGSDFMELVGAHKEALSGLDSIEAGAAAVGEDSNTGNAKNSLQKKESPTDQNDKTDNAMGTNGQLIQEEEREKGRSPKEAAGKIDPPPNVLMDAQPFIQLEMNFGQTPRLKHQQSIMRLQAWPNQRTKIQWVYTD
ncbi:Peptide exporter [Forsythia ovata]|uniref:Peptide exporter n=1 Tax=Forsythia ovata TaxID=205694 RepID=A0ABD1WYK1_9LAMI